MEGSAVLTEEIPKVVRKPANGVTNKAILWVTAVSTLVASVMVFLTIGVRFRETTLQVTKYGLLVNQGVLFQHQRESGTSLLFAFFLTPGYLSVNFKIYLTIRLKKFCNSSWRYRMKKRLFLAILLIFSMVEGCTMLAKSADAPRMTKDDLKARLSSPDLLIIDVRYGKDWTESDLKIRGAVREDPEAFDSWANKYPKDKTLVFYCA
jgi:hypothetical protein